MRASVKCFMWIQVSADGQLKCINKGCNKNYKPNDNHDHACRSAAAAAALGVELLAH